MLSAYDLLLLLLQLLLKEGLICLCTQDQAGTEVMFRVKGHTRLAKVIDAYIAVSALWCLSPTWIAASFVASSYARPQWGLQDLLSWKLCRPVM